MARVTRVQVLQRTIRTYLHPQRVTMRQLVWKQGNHAIPPGSPGFDPRHCKLSGVCCEGGCARPCPGWRFTRLSPIIQHPAGLWRRPKAWPASHSQIVAASVERPDTMCTDTQSRVLLPSEKKKKLQTFFYRNVTPKCCCFLDVS